MDLCSTCRSSETTLILGILLATSFTFETSYTLCNTCLNLTLYEKFRGRCGSSWPQYFNGSLSFSLALLEVRSTSSDIVYN